MRPERRPISSFALLKPVVDEMIGLRCD